MSGAERTRATPGEPVGPPRALALEEVELAIEKLVAGGDGLGRWRGIPIFVPRSAPGDRARVRLTERRPDFGRGEIVELLEPGPGRRTPPCPHFTECGGCDLQHLEDDRQLRLKADATMETLVRLSRCPLPPPRTIVAGAPWGYRLRTQLHLEADGERARLGYFARGSRRLVQVERCPVLEPALERALGALAESVAPPLPNRVDLAVGDDGTVVAAPPVAPFGGGEIERRIGEFSYRFDARTFFQGHAGLVGRLAELAVGPERGGTAYDLFAGVGLFALPMARRYSSVVAVEGDRVAARFAAKNARAAKLSGVEVRHLAVERWVAEGLPEAAERVVVDPPRDGLPFVVRKLLAARPAARLTYVSCHPATLARDLAELSSAYAVESLDLVDLFPQTGHLEVVVQLVREPRT
jgi:23S rRNA (uracil1939-C5)-methyltransferase